MMAGVRADIAVKIFGDDFKELERLAIETRDVPFARSRAVATWSLTLSAELRSWKSNRIERLLSGSICKPRKSTTPLGPRWLVKRSGPSSKGTAGFPLSCGCLRRPGVTLSE